MPLYAFNLVLNRKELEDLYAIYTDRNNDIIINDKWIWNYWIEKTLSIEGNIDLFVQLTEKQAFLTTGF